MKKLLFTNCIVFLFVSFDLLAQDPFITTWKTDNPGTSNDDQITVPTNGTGYNYTINWGDENVNNNVTGNITHTYDDPGTYIVTISGDFPQIFFNAAGDKEKILTVEQWGDIQWSSMGSAFRGCRNLSIPAVDGPDLSMVIDMSSMFMAALEFNSDISHWDVSGIKDMSNLFRATAFNHDLNDWEVGMVENMSGIFTAAANFDGNISDWNVENVLNMSSLFNSASSFNRDISGWNVGKVETMSSMFSQATAFNQNLSGWNVSSVTTMSSMFVSTSMTKANYDNLLIGWSQLTLKNDVPFRITSQYCNGADARDILTNTFNWDITDNGPSCIPFVTTWQTSSSEEMITIPTTGSGFDYDVDWGDGTVQMGFTGDASHTYSTADTYTVSISGDFPRIYFNFGGDKDKIMTIEQWGDIEWSSMQRAFYGCSNLAVNASDAPNLSQVTDMSLMFQNANNFNSDLSNWDVSNVENMGQLFTGASSFNGDISSWDTKNVETMRYMFSNAYDFNGDLSNWKLGP